MNLSRKQREKIIEKAAIAFGKKIIQSKVETKQRSNPYRDNTILQDDVDEEWRLENPSGLTKEGKKRI